MRPCGPSARRVKRRKHVSNEVPKDQTPDAHMHPAASKRSYRRGPVALAVDKCLPLPPAGPALTLTTLLMIVRIVLTWYPQIDGKKLPWSIAVKPTEPLLAPTRKVVPIVGGIDITPIVWVAVLSFINEILLGPQGILNLLQRKVDLP